MGLSDIVYACWCVDMIPIPVEFPSMTWFHKGICESYWTSTWFSWNILSLEAKADPNRSIVWWCCFGIIHGLRQRWLLLLEGTYLPRSLVEATNGGARKELPTSLDPYR